MGSTTCLIVPVRYSSFYYNTAGPINRHIYIVIKPSLHPENKTSAQCVCIISLVFTGHSHKTSLHKPHSDSHTHPGLPTQTGTCPPPPRPGTRPGSWLCCPWRRRSQKGHSDGTVSFWRGASAGDQTIQQKEINIGVIL